ncbi:hypothetical protein DUNSADRAFT_13921 [Dunaliella salina]|uniref:Uncharacterized protein n=1 Tax=Dunaliella salina TaxID=3046 RepID=A0ABQ7G8F0_DUNSA|nr:hypothetical protein DUNSADRAFT_13921 [Dunaliella salina]|eukprot:KAF5830886.1 hypothetical protein DUNSADRAFT_13921 [Dunaliella salina]
MCQPWLLGKWISDTIPAATQDKQLRISLHTALLTRMLQLLMALVINRRDMLFKANRVALPLDSLEKHLLQTAECVASSRDSPMPVRMAATMTKIMHRSIPPTPGPKLGSAYRNVTRSLKDELVVLKRPMSSLAFQWAKHLRTCVVENRAPAGAASQGSQHSTAAPEVEQGRQQAGKKAPAKQQQQQQQPAAPEHIHFSVEELLPAAQAEATATDADESDSSDVEDQQQTAEGQAVGEPLDQEEVPQEDTSEMGRKLDSREEEMDRALGPVCSKPSIHIGIRTWVMLAKNNTAASELSLLQRLQAAAWETFKEVCWARFGSLRPCIAARHICRRPAADLVISGAVLGSGIPSKVGNGTVGAVGVTTASAVGNGTASAVGNGTVGAVGIGTASAVGNGTASAVGNGTASAVGNGTASAVGNGTASAVGRGKASAVGNGTASAVGNASSDHAAAGDVSGAASRSSEDSTPGAGTSEAGASGAGISGAGALGASISGAGTGGAGGPASSSDAEAQWMATRFICAFINRACPLKDWAYGTSVCLGEVQQQLISDQAYGLVNEMRQRTATGVVVEVQNRMDFAQLQEDLIAPLTSCKGQCEAPPLSLLLPNEKTEHSVSSGISGANGPLDDVQACKELAQRTCGSREEVAGSSMDSLPVGMGFSAETLELLQEGGMGTDANTRGI